MIEIKPRESMIEAELCSVSVDGKGKEKGGKEFFQKSIEYAQMHLRMLVSSYISRIAHSSKDSPPSSLPPGNANVPNQ